MAKFFRPAGAFPPSIAGRGLEMACQSFVANDPVDQNLASSPAVTYQATIIG